MRKKRKEKRLKSQHNKFTCCLRCRSLGPKPYYTPPTKLEFFVRWILSIVREDKIDVVNLLVFLRRYEG